jgi:hypothetical protein
LPKSTACTSCELTLPGPRHDDVEVVPTANFSVEWIGDDKKIITGDGCELGGDGREKSNA